jgi:hypothetical protein
MSPPLFGFSNVVARPRVVNRGKFAVSEKLVSNEAAIRASLRPDEGITVCRSASSIARDSEGK